MLKSEIVKSIALKIIVAFNIFLHIKHVIIIFTSTKGLLALVFPAYNAMVYLAIFVILLIYNKWNIRRVLFLYFFPVYVMMLLIIGDGSSLFYRIFGVITSFYYVLLGVFLLFEWDVKPLRIDFPFRTISLIFFAVVICIMQSYIYLGNTYHYIKVFSNYLEALIPYIFILTIIAYIVLSIIVKLAIDRKRKRLELIKDIEDREHSTNNET